MADLALRRDLATWRRLAGARVRSEWQYRTSFVMFLASQALVACLDLAVIAAIFGQVDSLAGWSGVEVALLFGLGGVAFGLGDMFVSSVENASRHIKAGTFDLFLLRPLPALLHLWGSEFELRRVGRVLQPLVVLVGALVLAPITWTPDRALLVPVSLAAGTAIFGSVWVVTSSISFWTVESQELANAFTYGGSVVVHHPIDLLGQWLRRIFTFVFPLAFVAYYPAARLLGRDDVIGGSSLLAWASPVVAVGAVLGARAVWGAALRHHRSTGS